MMNKLTRRLSKIPDEVRGEIEPYFMNSPPVVEEDGRKLQKLDDNTADYVRTGLTVSQAHHSCSFSLSCFLITNYIHIIFLHSA